MSTSRPDDPADAATAPFAAASPEAMPSETGPSETGQSGTGALGTGAGDEPDAAAPSSESPPVITSTLTDPRTGRERVYESPLPLDDELQIDVERVLPTRVNAQAAAASGVIGGPIGWHAAIGRSRAWTPVRVVLLLALLAMSLSWFGKSGCIQQAPVDGQPGQVRLNWDNQRQFYGLCYTDLVAGYQTNRLTPGDLARGTMPFRTYWTENDGQTRSSMAEPVAVGMFAYGVAQLARGWQNLADQVPLIPDTLDVVAFFNIAALLLAVFWLLAVWATMRTDRRRPWLGALVALSPLAMVHAFTAYQVIPVMLVALALLCWAERRPLGTGIFLGLACASALYPLLLVVALGVICVRERRVAQWGTTVVTGAVAWTVVNLPILLNYPTGWGEYYRELWRNGAQPDSLYRVIEELGGWSPSTDLLNALWLLLLAAVVAGVAYAGLRARRTPTAAQLMFLLVAGYLLVGKEWSPENSLWLVPLAVLALGNHPRLLIAWMVVDALVWVPRMGLFLDEDRKWLPDDWFYAAVIVRAVVVAGLCAVVLYDMLRPRAPRTPQYVPPTDDLLTASPAAAVR